MGIILILVFTIWLITSETWSYWGFLCFFSFTHRGGSASLWGLRGTLALVKFHFVDLFRSHLEPYDRGAAPWCLHGRKTFFLTWWGTFFLIWALIITQVRNTGVKATSQSHVFTEQPSVSNDVISWFISEGSIFFSSLIGKNHICWGLFEVGPRFHISYTSSVLISGSTHPDH